MELQMFLEFPGVLITIGVILLLISIIIIIIAYKSSTKEVDASMLSTNKVHYNSTVNHQGYDDNGKPKIVIKMNNENDNLDKTKVFTPINNKEEKPNNINKMGIKDQIEKINGKETEEKPHTTIPKATINKPSIEKTEPTIDVIEEEFTSPSKKDLEKPKIKIAKPDEIASPRQEAIKTEEKTVIKKPVYVEEDEDIELL